MAITLPAGSLIYFNNTIKLSEHNRQPVTLGTERIEKAVRMANGTMRKFHVADKAEIQVSWTMLPSFSTFTVDGGYGAMNLKLFYEGTAAKAEAALSGRSTFDVKISYGNTVKTMEMMFTSCSFEIVKRNVKEKTTDTAQEFWNVNLTMVEI